MPIFRMPGRKALEQGRHDLALTPTQANRPRLNLSEVGATGHVISAGLLMEEDYNSDLRSPQLYHTYNRMRKSDGQVRAALSVIKLPLLSVDWHIDPASEDEHDIEVAEWMEDRLMNMTITWHNLLRQALLHLDFGNIPFEKVWEIKDNLVSLRKLAPRMPYTISEWRVDETGGLKDIQQNAWRANGFEVKTIPVEKLLVFINELEGSDYKGQSILRSAYKHWYFKDKLYIIDAIAKERRAVGIDVGTLKGSNVTQDDRLELENALMTLHAHEKQFMIEQEERYSYRVEGHQGTLASSMESIEHHDLRILRSVLAEFLAMGAGSSGSLAMHKDKSSFFIMALEAIAQNVCDTFNRYLIPQWYDYNWAPSEAGYPKLIHGRLDTRDVGALAEAVSKFMASGALTAGPEIEEEVRDVLGFPEMPEPDPTSEPEADPGLGPQPGEEEEPDLISDIVRNKRYKYRMTPTRIKFARTTDFSTINRVMDKGESDIIKAVKALQQKQIMKLAEVAVGKLAQGKLDELGDIVVPYKNELSDEIGQVLLEIYNEGRSQVAKQLKYELEDDKDAKTFIFMRAKATVGVLADRLKSNVIWRALEIFRDEKVDKSKHKEALEQSMKDLSDREIKKVASNSVSEALNLGRDSAARGQDLEAVYSSVLDSGTCGFCQSADGIRVKVGSAEYERLKPPYRECLGHGRCRCVFIYIGAED